MYNNVAIIGSSGAIGKAFIEQLELASADTKIYAFSRKIDNLLQKNVLYNKINYSEEESIVNASNIASKEAPLDLIIVATGVLHNNQIKPEKSLNDLSSEKFHYLFEVNTILPALIAKHFLPKMKKNKKAVFVILSARVGSITDNKLGGWYAYRASKAALNMIIKNIAIEVNRKYNNLIIAGLHPGTVDSNLSRPFQNNITKDRLFTPEYSVKKLLSVINSLTIEDSGKCFAWDASEIKA